MATGNPNSDFEVKSITYADLFKEISSYINATQEINIVKSNYLIQFSLYTSPNFPVPNGAWTTIGVLKDEYCPKIDVAFVGTVGPANYPSMYSISSNGTVNVYQLSGVPNQCSAGCIYILK